MVTLSMDSWFGLLTEKVLFQEFVNNVLISLEAGAAPDRLLSQLPRSRSCSLGSVSASRIKQKNIPEYSFLYSASVQWINLLAVDTPSAWKGKTR